MKKLWILGICSLLLTSASCSDEKKAPSWDEGDSCTAADMENDNGAECYKNKLYSCRNGKIMIDVCNYDCNVTNKKAHCKGEAPVNNNVTVEPGNNNRPGGGNNVQRPDSNTEKPVAGASCDDSFKEYCSAAGDEIAYCGEDNRVVVKKCSTGCMFDDADYATCIVDCGNVGEDGTCSDNVLKFCYSDGKNKTLIVEECLNGETCGLVNSLKGSYYDCVEKSTPSTPTDPPSSKCGDVPKNGKCSEDGNSALYCVDDNIIPLSCENGCSVKNGIAGCKCGNITSDGICKEKELIYCMDNNQLTSAICENGCVAPAGSYADCFKPCGTVPRDGICVDDKTLKFCDDNYGLIERKCIENCVSGGGFSNCLNDRYE